MNFKIISRDGPARLGEVELDKKKIKFPNILFIHTDRFKSPDYSEIILTNTKKTNNKPSIKYTENILLDESPDKEGKDTFFNLNKQILTFKFASQNLNQSKKFTDFIVNNRQKNMYENLLYIPSIAEPLNLSLLCYMGVDFFDSTRAIISAREKIMFFPYENIRSEDVSENPCTCPICSKIDKKPKDMTFEEILNHNYSILYSELKNIRNHIRNKRLRDLVEKRIKSNPNITSIIRYLDQKYYDYLEEKTPVVSNNNLFATTLESMNRPEIKRYQKRVISRFKKPDSTKILLLLPCSAKKPYSFSKSHSFFKKAIFSTKNPYIIHEVIITSPLGIVPRELELVYPVKNYDIPVTGTWTEDEKYMINDLLDGYIKKNRYNSIISHLPKEINDFIKKNLKIKYFTSIKNPTSEESIKKLTEVLKNESEKYKKVKRSDRIKEDIKELASYQFDRNFSEKLLNKATIKGKYPYSKIMKNNTQLGMLVKEKGFISLTLEGGGILFETNRNIVRIYDDFILKGSVFAPGVKDADENIRIGDEVVVVRNNEIVGVGSALMSGPEMKKLRYGEAINIRHIKKD